MYKTDRYRSIDARKSKGIPYYTLYVLYLMGALMAFDSPNLVLQFLGHSDVEREREKKRREGAIFLTFPREAADRRSACCFELALRVPTGQ